MQLTSLVCGFLHFIVEVQNWSAWHAALGYLLLQTIHLYFSGLTVPQTGPAFLKFHLMTQSPSTNML